jgi:hypothetical protein
MNEAENYQQGRFLGSITELSVNSTPEGRPIPQESGILHLSNWRVEDVEVTMGRLLPTPGRSDNFRTGTSQPLSNGALGNSARSFSTMTGALP